MTVVALGLSTLLGASALAEPDPRGLGTHQRFGLPPCSFRVLLGWPCPTCGMTTSWAHLVRGELVGALRANAGGAILCGLAIAATPWLLISAGRGTWLGWTPNSMAIAATATAVSLITLIAWVVRLVAG